MDKMGVEGEKVKLADVCSKASSSYAQKDLDGLKGEYPVYGASGYLTSINKYHQENDYVAVVKDGAGIGRTMFLPAKSSIIGTMQYLIPKDNIIPKYLYYAVKNMHLEKYYSGATIPHIYFKDYQKEEFNLPDAVRQQKIIDVLERAENLIGQRREQLEYLDALIKSRFVEMFGDLADPLCQWKTERIVDVCANPDDIKCGPFGTQLSKDEYQSEGVAVWEIPQINSFFQERPTHFLTEGKALQLDAYSLKPGDIAMSRKGNVGKCAVFPEGYENGIIHSDVLRIRVDKAVTLPVFMMHQLHYSDAVQHQIALVSSGAIMAGINVTKLKEIRVHIPPIELQQQFADFVSATDKSKLAVQKSLDELKVLFDSLMQKYFG